MTALTPSDYLDSAMASDWHQAARSSLLRGEILIATQSHTAWGGAVTASMYLPLSRSKAWQQLTDYPRWVKFFPDLTHSQVLELNQNSKRLYQVARKTFLFLSIQAEIYLKVVEISHRQIKFYFEKGNFVDFSADLKLEDCETGTIITYSVQATPSIPVPSIFIQQAMHLDLPANMRQMRQVMCEQ